MEIECNNICVCGDFLFIFNRQWPHCKQPLSSEYSYMCWSKEPNNSLDVVSDLYDQKFNANTPLFSAN